MKKIIVLLIIGVLTLSLMGCDRKLVPPTPPTGAPTSIPAPQSATPTAPPTAAAQPSLSGLKLGDSKEKAIEILGRDYKAIVFEEREHFPEPFIKWDYNTGYTLIIGKDSGKILEITATNPKAETNLGAKVGDTAQTVLRLYRAQYKEPTSLHGGFLPGVFKIENGQALIFDFNMMDGLVNPDTIKDTDILERIILTLPAYLDDDF